MLLPLKETVEKHGLLAQKSLGQNFLLDQNITNKIIALSLNKQGLANFNSINICEVGPGPGGLTRAILNENPSSISVIEMDRRCIAIMEELKHEYNNIPFNIINGDALKYDISKEVISPRQVISNLPYNVSVPLLIGWLKNIKEYSALTLMFQKEVAERIMAEPRTKDYGRISILSQLTCKIDKLMDLSPECFIPAPKIWSTVLLFQPKEEKIPSHLIENIEKITSLAFGQRRKMLRQSLKSMPNLLSKFEELGIQPTARAEELTPEQFLTLASNF